MKEYKLDYLLDNYQCSAMAYFKHIVDGKKEGTHEQMLAFHFKESMSETLYYYFANKQNGRQLSLKQLYDKLTKTWHTKIGYDTGNVFETDMTLRGQRERNYREKYLLKGYENLKKFYNDDKKKEQVILGVNYEYRVKWKNIAIVGRMDLIREIIDKEKQTRFIEIVSFKQSLRKPDAFFIQHDIGSTFTMYAFKELFGHPPDRYVLDYLGANENVELKRNERDFQILARILDSVTEDINRENIYPRYGIGCKGCFYQEYCKEWGYHE